MSTDKARLRGISLHTVLIMAFLACISALLIFLAFALMPRISALLETNAIERTKETVLQSVNSMDIYVDSLLSTLHYASTLLPDEPAKAGDEWRRMLSILKKSNSDILEMALFGQSGSCFYSTAGEPRLDSAEIRKAEWFQKAILWEGTVTYFSAPHVQNLFTDRRTYVITMSRAVEYMQDGQQYTGVLMMDINYTAFASLSDNLHLGTSGYAYLMDEAGRLIAHPRLQLIYAGLAAEDISKVGEQVVGVTRDVQAGRERVLMITTLNQTRWRMVGVAYIDEILKLQSTFVRIFTLMLLSAAMLSLATATVMAYLVTRPINHLEHKMRMVEEGDLNVAITVKGFREIRSVSSAFNHMIQRVRQLMEQIVQEQETKRLYELNALQAQINPHFLYNTLDSIIWMEERGRSREAITMVSALAKLFRISISKGRDMISVGEEIEHVRNYIIIQKMRFKDKFDYEINVQPEALQERTVKLILQPLVENAINHAIDELRSTPLHIFVEARVEGGCLLFTIRDDGVGLCEERLQTILTKSSGSSGIGIKNVHERIRLTFGKPYGLEIKSEEDVGTCVIIRLPRVKETDV